MICMVQNDPKSRTCQNLKYLNELTNDNCLTMSPFEWKQLLPRQTIPENHTWRVTWLQLMLEVQQSQDYARLNLNKEQFRDMFDSLCISQRDLVYKTSFIILTFGAIVSNKHNNNNRLNTNNVMELSHAQCLAQLSKDKTKVFCELKDGHGPQKIKI